MGGAVIVGAIIGAGIGGGMAMKNDQNILGGAVMGAAGGAAAGYGIGAAAGVGAAGGAAGGAGASAAETASLSTGGQLVAAPSAGLAGAPSVGASVAPAAGGASEGLIGGMTAGDIAQVASPIVSQGVSMAMRPEAPQIPGAVPPPTRESVVVNDPLAQRRQQESPAQIDRENELRRQRQQAHENQLADEERRRIEALVSVRGSMDPASAYYKRDRTALERLYGTQPGYGQARFGSV